MPIMVEMPRSRSVEHFPRQQELFSGHLFPGLGQSRRTALTFYRPPQDAHVRAFQAEGRSGQRGQTQGAEALREKFADARGNFSSDFYQEMPELTLQTYAVASDGQRVQHESELIRVDVG